MLLPQSKFYAVALTVTFCGLSSMGGELNAQTPSLWQRRDHQMTDLVADVKARRVGDLLFITIQEQSDVDNTDQRLLQKQNNSSSSADGSYSVGGGIGNAAGNLGFDQDSASNRQFNGNTEFRSERGFTDSFTVRVVDNLPNGNLLISGSRDMTLEGDNRRLILTGVVRSTDITATNTVSSGLVSDLIIRYESHGSTGPEQHFVNQGWLARKVNKLWPY